MILVWPQQGFRRIHPSPAFPEGVCNDTVYFLVMASLMAVLSSCIL